MRFTLLLITLLPLALGAKELLGEEIPSKDVPDEIESLDKDDSMMVKRSINDIAARRRSVFDKNFMRSDPSMAKSSNFMRFGRAKQDFMRFGRATKGQNVMRFGRSPNFMRFGRAGNNMMRFGRASNNLMRFGRAGNNMMRFGRGGNNMMRFGRGGNNMMRFGRGGNNMMRFGRSDDDFLNLDNLEGSELDEVDNEDEGDAMENFYREDRSAKDEEKTPKYDEKEANKKKPYLDDGFMRFGRITTDNPNESFNEEDFEMLFPNESRKKRSLDSNQINGETSHRAENSKQPDTHQS